MHNITWYFIMGCLYHLMRSLTKYLPNSVMIKPYVKKYEWMYVMGFIHAYSPWCF